MTTKKARLADSPAGLTQAFIDAAKGLAKPPKHVKLRPKDRPFFDAIVSLKACDDWTELHLVAAVQLARTQCDIEDWMLQMEGEEPVILAPPNNIPKMNPLLQAIELATRRQLAIMRAIGVATAEDPRDAKKRQQTLRSAREAREKLGSESLLAS